MKKVLVIDNYDSFTYNLVHILRELGYSDRMDVFRNDKIEVSKVDQYDHILLSPGPGLPADAGIMPAVIQRYAPTKNILGVCLGHQGIGEAFGAKLFNLPIVFHGVTTAVNIVEVDKIFSDLPESFEVCRYHSWAIDNQKLPAELQVTATDDHGNVMGLRHRQFNVRGVQFHPESVMTEHGIKMIENWLSIQ
ncbi:MAG: aminodeoxychorismate/anthranilate synthase component II [Cyclobacteriaceae bacterium]|nr:aminodeoxychorismate/anthranilate synthase component II [Cyclobacteriaceae bacterium HetDA_MAG_MS6]